MSASALNVYSKERSGSPDLFATCSSEPDPAISRAGLYLSEQQHTSLVPTSGLTFTTGAQTPAVWQAPRLFVQGGHGEGGRAGVQDLGYCLAPPTHCLASQVSGLPLQVEMAFSSAATTCGPLLRGFDTSNAGISALLHVSVPQQVSPSPLLKRGAYNNIKYCKQLFWQRRHFACCSVAWCGTCSDDVLSIFESRMGSARW